MRYGISSTQSAHWESLRERTMSINLLQGASGYAALPRHEQLWLSSPASSISEAHLCFYLQGWQMPPPMISAMSTSISTTR